MQYSNLEVPRHLFASRLNAHSQTDWAIEDQAKNLHSTARPYDEWAFSPLDFTAVWLSHLPAWFICLIFSNSSSWLQCCNTGMRLILIHQRFHCLLSCWFRRRSKKTSKLRVTGLSEGNSSVTGELPAQKASNAENVCIWLRHHVLMLRRYTGVINHHNGVCCKILFIPLNSIDILKIIIACCHKRRIETHHVWYWKIQAGKIQAIKQLAHMIYM